MAIRKYLSLNGRLRGSYVTRSQKTWFLTDALGSVTATLNNSGNVISTYRYKPYGATLATTGVGGALRFGWAGDTGSRYSARNYAEQYNWHRHYGHFQGQWTTRDILWPGELAYGYVNGSPVTYVDPSGQAVVTCGTFKCEDSLRQDVGRCCKEFNKKFEGGDLIASILKCMDAKGFGGYGYLTTLLLDYLNGICNPHNNTVTVSLQCPSMSKPPDWPPNCPFPCDLKNSKGETFAVAETIPAGSQMEVLGGTGWADCGMLSEKPGCDPLLCPGSNCTIIVCDTFYFSGPCRTFFHEAIHCGGPGHLSGQGNKQNDFVYTLAGCIQEYLFPPRR